MPWVALIQLLSVILGGEIQEANARHADHRKQLEANRELWEKVLKAHIEFQTGQEKNNEQTT